MAGPLRRSWQGTVECAARGRITRVKAGPSLCSWIWLSLESEHVKVDGYPDERDPLPPRGDRRRAAKAMPRAWHAADNFIKVG